MNVYQVGNITYSQSDFYKEINKFWLGWILLLTLCICLQCLGYINSPHDYHNFIDKRNYFGIGNFFDVMSNLSFLMAGFYIVIKNYLVKNKILSLYLLGLGCMLVSLGSGYYHLHPSNATLLWDRLPMTFVFASIISYSLERTKLLPIKVSSSLFTSLYLVFSIASVLVWYYGALKNKEYLGLYVFVQFGGMLLLIYMAYYANKIGDKGYLKAVVYTLAFYTFAKLCESFDSNIFHLTSQIFSGHTVKHIFSALALVCFYKQIAKSSESCIV